MLQKWLGTVKAKKIRIPFYTLSHLWTWNFKILSFDKILEFILISSAPLQLPPTHKQKGPETLKLCMHLVKDTDQRSFSKTMSHLVTNLGPQISKISPPFG